MIIPTIIFILLPLLITWFTLMFIFRKKIDSFIHPENYILVEMLEMDNNVREWLQRKNNSLTFIFNKGTYNMFTGENKTIPSIYREGRLAKLFYVEGNAYPLDFRNNKLTGDPYLNSQLDSINLSNLFFEEDEGLLFFIKKYWWIFLILIGLFVVFNMFKGG